MSQFYFYINFEYNFIVRFKISIKYDFFFIHYLIINFYYFILLLLLLLLFYFSFLHFSLLSLPYLLSPTPSIPRHGGMPPHLSSIIFPFFFLLPTHLGPLHIFLPSHFFFFNSVFSSLDFYSCCCLFYWVSFGLFELPLHMNWIVDLSGLFWVITHEGINSGLA